MSLTDARRMWVLLRDAGTEGVHSHQLRQLGVSGNPSQRSKDIASKGVAIFTARENRGKRPGSRYWLAEHAPDWAAPVQPNRAAQARTFERGVEGGSGGDPCNPPAAVSLDTEPINLVCDATDRRDIRWREEAA